MNLNPKSAARLAALTAAVLFSTGGLAVKLVDLPPLAISGGRSAIAAVCLGLFIVFGRRESIRVDLGLVGWTAAVSYFLSLTAYVVANKLTTAANVIFLQYTMPAWVLIFGALWLGERVTTGRAVSVIVSMGGLTLFFLEEMQPQQWQGNLLSIFAGVTFAYVVLAMRRMREIGGIHLVFWGNAMIGATLLPASLIAEPGLLVELIEPSTLAGLLWLGVFQVAVAYIFYSSALSRLAAVEVAILSLVEPVMNPVWVFWQLGETPSPYALIGGSVILAVVFARSLIPARKISPQPEADS